MSIAVTENKFLGQVGDCDCDLEIAWFRLKLCLEHCQDVAYWLRALQGVVVELFEPLVHEDRETGRKGTEVPGSRIDSVGGR